jgi:hypothetical protein
VGQTACGAAATEPGIAASRLAPFTRLGLLAGHRQNPGGPKVRLGTSTGNAPRRASPRGEAFVLLRPGICAPAWMAGGGRVNAVRVVLIIVDAVVAVTAVGGGIVLAAGLEGGRFPARWLKGTPFSSYLVPGLILAVVGAARRFPSRLPGDARAGRAVAAAAVGDQGDVRASARPSRTGCGPTAPEPKMTRITRILERRRPGSAAAGHKTTRRLGTSRWAQ